MDDKLEDAKRHFFAGLGHFEAGRWTDAEASFVASLALFPLRPSTLCNLGATRLKLGRPADALAVLDQALALDPADLEAWSHKGVALAELGRPLEALACHDNVLAVDPRRVSNWLHRGIALSAVGRVDEALAAYDEALALDPALALAWSHRGGILRDMQRLDDAKASFEQALALGADAELNRYFLAAVGGGERPPAAPGRYVEPLFDDYAASFDEHLVEALNYRAHAVLVDGLRGLDRAGRYRSALDLGCGTGLCGPLLAPIVDRLDGVDLSRNMLDKARGRGVYASLVHAELIDCLQASDADRDLVVAADVFIYIGDLAPVFAGVAGVLRRGGVFCFSAELTDADAAGFTLLPSLRYAHSERYLRELAERCGFAVVAATRAPIRDDQRRAIDGLYLYLRRR